jgi:cytochrome c oxidase subunit IV
VFTFLLLSLATFFYMCYSLVQQSTIHGFSFGMVVGWGFPLLRWLLFSMLPKKGLAGSILFNRMIWKRDGLAFLHFLLPTVISRAILIMSLDGFRVSSRFV